jgi:hypothetical protein
MLSGGRKGQSNGFAAGKNAAHRLASQVKFVDRRNSALFLTKIKPECSFPATDPVDVRYRPEAESGNPRAEVGKLRVYCSVGAF